MNNEPVWRLLTIQRTIKGGTKINTKKSGLCLFFSNYTCFPVVIVGSCRSWHKNRAFFFCKRGGETYLHKSVDEKSRQPHWQWTSSTLHRYTGQTSRIPLHLHVSRLYKKLLWKMEYTYIWSRYIEYVVIQMRLYFVNQSFLHTTNTGILIKTAGGKNRSHII